jgi:ferrous iron transport protein A
MNAKPLSSIPEAHEVRVREVRAGRGLARRLMEMGFVTNALVRVIKSSFNGPMIVAVNDVRFALSFGIAMKILVVNS